MFLRSFGWSLYGKRRIVRINGEGKKEEQDQKGERNNLSRPSQEPSVCCCDRGISGTIAGIVLFVCNRPRISASQVFRECRVHGGSEGTAISCWQWPNSWRKLPPALNAILAIVDNFRGVGESPTRKKSNAIIHFLKHILYHTGDKSSKIYHIINFAVPRSDYQAERCRSTI